MVPFSLFFHHSYSVAPYDLTKPRMLPLSEIVPPYNNGSDVSNAPLTQQPPQAGGRYYGGVLGIKAWVGVLDPRMILRAIVFSFTMRNTADSMGREVVGAQGEAYRSRR